LEKFLGDSYVTEGEAKPGFLFFTDGKDDTLTYFGFGG
jgi:hypothetical protein